MIYKGNPVSAGIAIGSAFVYDPKILTAPEDAPVLPMECELERYENAVQAAQAKLREIQAAFTGKDDDKAEIFSAHLDMVDDEELLELVEMDIREMLSEYSCRYRCGKGGGTGIPAVCRSVGSPG